MRQTPLKRGSGLKRTGTLRRTELKAKPRKELPPEARTFKGFYVGRPCASCRLYPAQVTHHVVLEQYLKGPDKWRLENAMALCHACHSAHHSPNGPRVRRLDLTEAHLNFASEVLGGMAGSYFARRYA